MLVDLFPILFLLFLVLHRRAHLLDPLLISILLLRSLSDHTPDILTEMDVLLGYITDLDAYQLTIEARALDRLAVDCLLLLFEFRRPEASNILISQDHAFEHDSHSSLILVGDQLSIGRRLGSHVLRTEECPVIELLLCLDILLSVGDELPRTDDIDLGDWLALLVNDLATVEELLLEVVEVLLASSSGKTTEVRNGLHKRHHPFLLLLLQSADRVHVFLLVEDSEVASGGTKDRGDSWLVVDQTKLPEGLSLVERFDEERVRPVGVDQFDEFSH